jgi:predicted DNA-binding transcriptional regulator AlpA
MTVSKLDQQIIYNTYKEHKSVTVTEKLTGFSYRTIIKYIDRSTFPKDEEIIRIYFITGRLEKVAELLNISKTTVWRRLIKNKTQVGKGSPTWKSLYKTLRARVSRSEWRKKILIRDNYSCVVCSKPAKNVHHLKKLSDVRRFCSYA